MHRALNANRAHSLSDQEMTEGMAEIELRKLQRQYRIMEGDRRAYSEESRLVITKQRQTIEQLKRDQAYLVEELRLLEGKQEELGKDGTANRKAEELAEEAELYDRKIRTAHQQIAELDEQIAELDRRISKQRHEMGGVNAATITSLSIQKRIRILENRLDKSLTKFNEALAQNKHLRDTIDNLRRERAVFDNIRRKFEREIAEQDKRMADAIESANAAYEARDEAQAKTIGLKEKAEKEKQAHLQEIKELDRFLEQDRKLKDFMAKKASERHEDGSQSGPRHPLTDKSDMIGKGSLDMVSETMESNEAAFHRIRQVTGISDLGELVSRFKEIEDQNFSLFNYVNEINNEIEKTTEKTAEIEDKIRQFKEEQIVIDKRRTAVMQELEAKINASEERRRQYEKQYSDTTFLLDGIRAGVENLVQKINTAAREQAGAARQVVDAPPPASEEPFINFSTNLTMAGPGATEGQGVSGSGITNANLLHCLSVIEQKTNELLIANFATALPKRVGGVEEKDAAGAAQPPSLPSAGSVVGLGLVAPQQTSIGGLLGQGPLPPVGNISIVPPSTGDEHDTEEGFTDEDERPLSREELTQKTLRGLSRRTGQIATGVKAAKAKRRDRF